MAGSRTNEIDISVSNTGRLYNPVQTSIVHETIHIPRELQASSCKAGFESLSKAKIVPCDHNSYMLVGFN